MTTLFHLALGKRFASLLASDEKVVRWGRLTPEEQAGCRDLIYFSGRVYAVVRNAHETKPEPKSASDIPSVAPGTRSRPLKRK